MERILKWRISPTFANHENVPHPFRPTVLQQHFNNRHPYIDFIPWSELRDQVLLHMGQLDVTQLLEDLIHNYVHEVPGLNAALPLLAAYRDVVKQCTTNVAQYSGGKFSDDEDPQSSVFYLVTSIFRKYGLDKYAERKLDPVFCEKYPLFDVQKSEHCIHPICLSILYLSTLIRVIIVVTKLPVIPYAVAIANMI